MPTGKRTPDEIKKQVAKRFHKGESSEALAQEFGVSVFSIREWGKLFPRKQPGPKRNVAPKENTSVSKSLEAENRGLREEVQRLRGLLLDEILRNRSV